MSMLSEEKQKELGIHVITNQTSEMFIMEIECYQFNDYEKVLISQYDMFSGVPLIERDLWCVHVFYENWRAKIYVTNVMIEDFKLFKTYVISQIDEKLSELKLSQENEKP